MWFKKRKVNSYWSQEITISRELDRISILEKYCNGMKVLHIGCTDFPIFNKDNNLHLKLAEICKEIHGMDIDVQGLAQLKKHYDGKYFSELAECKEEMYDVCLIPETIEHVENIGAFLGEVSTVKAKKFIFTAPNCFHSPKVSRFKINKNKFTEIVHPDHNVWFSPFTLSNVIKKYSGLKIENVILSHQDTVIILIASQIE